MFDINHLVSIPFKRESVSKAVEISTSKAKKKPPFQFPSNGKVYPKRPTAERCWSQCDVSIPFKRESVSKVNLLLKPLHLVVSIPFKRESVSKVAQRQRHPSSKKCFNSLQTGKCIQRGSIRSFHLYGHFPVSFNSLQTGKCIQRRRRGHRRERRHTKCFNSLQTGKCIQSPRHHRLRRRG